MSRRSRSFTVAVLTSAVLLLPSPPSEAKTPANCRILTFDGAAGATSFDKVTFRAVDAFGVELDRSCLNQVQTSETAQHFAQRLPGDWGDGQCVVPVPTPVPPAAPLNNTCGTGTTGASCRHKYKLKNGAATVRICCYEGPNCKGNKLGKTNTTRVPMSIQQKKDPAPAFGPTPVPIAVAADQVALDPIGVTQAPFRESEGCRDKLAKSILGYDAAVLRTLGLCHAQQMKGLVPGGVDCNSVNPASDVNGAIASSRASMTAVANGQCAPGGLPARLGYHPLCPAPCAAVNHCTAGNVGPSCVVDADCDGSPMSGDGRCGPGGDWTQEIACLACLVESAGAAAIADKYGSVGAGPSQEAQKCQDLIGDGLTLLVNALDGATLDCQKKLDAGKLGLVFCQNGQCTGPPALRGLSCTKDDDCIDPSVRLCKYADMSGTRAAAELKISQKLSAGCNDGELAELDSCTTTAAGLGSCVVTNARAVADALADAQYPEGVGRTPCVPGPPCPTPGGPTPLVTPTPATTATPNGSEQCPNGIVEPGEDCDPPGSQCPNAAPGILCSAACQCACPGSIELTGTSTDGVLDVGWTGIVHDASVVSDGTITVDVTSCLGSSRPCGVCSFTGPIPNAGAANYGTGTGSLINNQRCTGNTRKTCGPGGEDPGCAIAGGTCEFYYGTLFPFAAGGVGLCIEQRLIGSMTGTANIESGALATSGMNLLWKISNGASVVHPCPRCVGDPNPNDGVRAGTCDNGLDTGMPCDVNGKAPNENPGATSLDCRPSTMVLGTQPLDLSGTTGAKTKTLTAASPSCRAVGHTSSRCMCDTCDNAAGTPCSSNADCAAVGAMRCGGKRCQSGTNGGAQCANNSECPGSSCGVPGVATAPNECLGGDLDCAPGGSPGPNDGQCQSGDTDFFCQPNGTMVPCTFDGDCAAAGAMSCTGGTRSGHVCSVAADCPGGTCDPEQCTGIRQRECYLDGGQMGGHDDATGAATLPVNDASNPTLASLFCLGPTTSGSTNAYVGLPGLGRLELQMHVQGRP